MALGKSYRLSQDMCIIWACCSMLGLGLGQASGSAQHSPSQVGDLAAQLSAAQQVPQPPLAAGLIMLPPLISANSMKEQIKTSPVSNYVAMGEAISS